MFSKSNKSRHQKLQKINLQLQFAKDAVTALAAFAKNPKRKSSKKNKILKPLGKPAKTDTKNQKRIFLEFLGNI